jgi:hypothetical protein
MRLGDERQALSAQVEQLKTELGVAKEPARGYLGRRIDWADRFTGRQPMHWITLRSLESISTTDAAPFLLDRDGDLLVQALGDPLQEHLPSLVRREAHGDDRPAPIMHSVVQQLLAQNLRAKLGFEPQLGGIAQPLGRPGCCPQARARC